ncbi:helix-turn-helix domain-containing protein [Actinoplanes sp. NPDC004185]
MALQRSQRPARSPPAPAPPQALLENPETTKRAHSANKHRASTIARIGMGKAEVETQSPDFVYTVAEAAQQLKIGRTAMYELVMSGQVRSVTIGRSRRVPSSCIADYLTQLLEQSADVPAAA